MTVWWSKAILIGGIIGAACLLIGALGSRFGIWPFTTGFMLLASGTVLGILALLGGIVAFFVAGSKGLQGDRPGIVLGALVGALVTGLMGLQFATASSVPPIHNITTDVADPPQFDKVIALRTEGANPLAYDAAELADKQRAAYPDVKTLQLAQSPEQAFAAAVIALESMGLEVVDQNPAAGRIEATATTRWFGFKDDIVVRIRPSASGVAVDARSVSRVGQSDLGANARRIMRLFGHLSGN